MKTCPKCHEVGSSIHRQTLKAQVKPERFAMIQNVDAWRMCTSSTCLVLYFRETEEVSVDEARNTAFHKSEDPNRPVCFCFKHTVAAVETDVKRNGRSTIFQSIKAACKAGDDDCRKKNPQGRCCLANVLKVVKWAGATPPEPTKACCSSK